MDYQTLSEAVEAFRNLLVAQATGGSADSAEYRRLRDGLLASPIASSLPRFVRTCADPSQFWNFIRQEHRGYAARRDFLWAEFGPIIEALDAQHLPGAAPALAEGNAERQRKARAFPIPVGPGPPPWAHGAAPKQAEDARSDLDNLVDVFICHASEDKAAIARPLHEALVARGISTWFDEAELRVGDKLSRKIDEGLARCRYGVVIVSAAFFKKNWPQRELGALVEREVSSGKKAILPVWHGVTHADVLAFSPTLADAVAVDSARGIDNIVAELIRVLRG